MKKNPAILLAVVLCLAAGGGSARPTARIFPPISEKLCNRLLKT